MTTLARKVRGQSAAVAPLNPDLARQLKSLDAERARLSQVARAIPKTDPDRRAAAFQRAQAVEQREQQMRARAHELIVLRKKEMKS